MDWSEVGKLVAPLAPTIGNILGGFIPVPGGALLGQVAGKVIAEALGVPPTPTAVATAVQTGDPATVQAALSEADARMNAEVEKFKAALADVQDARATTVKLDAQGSSIRWGAPVISVVIVIGFFSVMTLLFIVKSDFPPATVTLLNVLFGALIPAFGQVCNYWLGSSAGSANKDQYLAAAPPIALKPVLKK
jgi:hypothetical protein